MWLAPLLQLLWYRKITSGDILECICKEDSCTAVNGSVVSCFSVLACPDGLLSMAVGINKSRGDNFVSEIYPLGVRRDFALRGSLIEDLINLVLFFDENNSSASNPRELNIFVVRNNGSSNKCNENCNERKLQALREHVGYHDQDQLRLGYKDAGRTQNNSRGWIYWSYNHGIA
ncbi:hypothetical protein BU23DRAFT_635475 [Bimuria novae-zelandiae CBS 107.79]|uniref:Uncharacterized protein n=1 Tax=Bimuria novae-zelandiae CBS 107.79 TaxID=1447943 RepID=A0A6A5VC98_9PLEO|nr:hypothetical protein BU23DRAFT_635475 [Bimuria novae-zelandiae CBS 107.79]